MNCTICQLPIQLRPTAQERAAKYGGKPSGYTRLFTSHSSCELAKRNADVLALITRRQEG